MLKPQDVLVALKLTVTGKEWTYPILSNTLGLSLGECHLSIQRLKSSRLCEGREITAPSLTEFLLHGVRYAFPAGRKGPAIGLVTAWALPLLQEEGNAPEDTPVWPYAGGAARGWELTPLYPSAPLAAAQDDRLYELLALVDSIREGDTTQRTAAGRLLRDRLPAARREAAPRPARVRRTAPPVTPPTVEVEAETEQRNADTDSPIDGIARRLRALG